MLFAAASVEAQYPLHLGLSCGYSTVLASLAVSNGSMACVDCFVGAIFADHYRSGLAAAGFGKVRISDAGADLNADVQIEGRARSRSPSMSAGLTVAWWRTL